MKWKKLRAVRVRRAAIATSRRIAASWAGALEILRTPGEGSVGASFAFGSSDPAAYAVTLTAGRYVFWHAANPASCTGPIAPAVPCASQALLGCTP